MTAQKGKNTVLGDDGAGIRRNAPRRSIGCHRTRGRCTIRQKDVTRALRGAVAAGVEVQRIEIDTAGKIIMVTGKPKEQIDEGGGNEWDKI
jgi:hypothetical protein